MAGVLALLLVSLLIPGGAFAAIVSGEWQKEWEQTKKDFESATKKKKPAKTFMGKFRQSSGIEKSLKNMDAAYKEINSGKVTKKAVDKFESAFNTFVTKKDDYLKVLKKALKDEKIRTAPTPRSWKFLLRI